MNIAKRLIALAGIIAIAFSIAAHAALEKKMDSKSSAPAVSAQKGELNAMRKGSTVTIIWTLPEGEWRGIEILRNDKPERKGTPKLKSVRLTPAKYVDEVPDVGAQYWYWLKVTSTDGKIINIGPAEAK